ncbi:hypothetical protein FPQ18DRAFT_301120 [Pyronema domesticum]|nr:hypothetical protein FPQ18DRAFT_301120 [Pyronema domesticum]
MSLRQLREERRHTISFNVPGHNGHDGNYKLNAAEPCRHNRVSVVESLLKKTIFNGWTALMYACNGGYFSAVESLLKKEDIQVNLQQKDGRTALKIASDKKYVTISIPPLQRKAIVAGARQQGDEERVTTGAERRARRSQRRRRQRVSVRRGRRDEGEWRRPWYPTIPWSG